MPDYYKNIRVPGPAYIIGDFNARHANLEHSSTNITGRNIMKLIKYYGKKHLGPKFPSQIGIRHVVCNGGETTVSSSWHHQILYIIIPASHPRWYGNQTLLHQHIGLRSHPWAQTYINIVQISTDINEEDKIRKQTLGKTINSVTEKYKGPKAFWEVQQLQRNTRGNIKFLKVTDRRRPKYGERIQEDMNICVQNHI